MENDKCIVSIYKPIRQLLKIIPYILRRGLIPLFIGAAMFAIVYVGFMEIINRNMAKYFELNMFNPIIFSMIMALITFSMYNFGLQRSEYSVLGVSRRDELIMSYIFAVVYSIVIAIFTVSFAYAFQKLFSLNCYVFNLDLDYSVKSYIGHVAIVSLINLAAFAITRVAVIKNEKISIILLLIIIVLVLVSLSMLLAVCDEIRVLNDTKIELYVIFGWKYMLPFGLIPLTICAGLDVFKTKFEYFR